MVDMLKCTVLWLNFVFAYMSFKSRKCKMSFLYSIVGGVFSGGNDVTTKLIHAGVFSG